MLYVRLIKGMVVLGLGLSLLSGCKAGSAKFKKPTDKTLPPEAGTTPPPDSGGGGGGTSRDPVVRASTKVSHAIGSASGLDIKISSTSYKMRVAFGGRVMGASSASDTSGNKVLTTTTGVGHGL